MTNKSEVPDTEENKDTDEIIDGALTKGSAMMRFWIWRDEDETGVSGTGRVAEGVEFSDGVVVVHWISSMPSTNIYPNIKQVETIHGHEGKTRVIFIDKPSNGNGKKENLEEEINE